jgi:NADH-quinone oxidoreductase subunit H
MSLTEAVRNALAALHLPVEWATALTALLAGVLLLFLWILPVVTYMIWWLRRLLGFMQSRLGPNRVGPEGLLQTPADALKLLTKEDIIPALADRWMFILAPALVFVPAFLVYLTLPMAPNLVAQDLNVGVVYVAAVTSVTVIGIVLAAWSSNNKYALVAAFRAAAQIVSYEVPLAIAMLTPIMIAQSLSLKTIVVAQAEIGWFILYQPIIFLAFVAAAMAENNVTPFDIVEAESEIVAGFHVEYSGMKFALFFLAEFANTLTVGALTTLLFLGGWHNPFSAIPVVAQMGESVRTLLETTLGQGSIGYALVMNLYPFGWFVAKTFTLVSVVFWIRGTLPRVRVDQLMDFGWKLLIPLGLANMTVTGGFIAFSLPTWGLALFNWLVFLIVLAIGATKRVPVAQKAARGPLIIHEGRL